jgi:hypothetical protein
MSEGVGGEPAGKRRWRRLTLAPRPRATARRGEGEAKVSATFFADSGGSDGEVAGRSEVRWESSSVGSSSDIRFEFKQAVGGSRFWALAVEESSDGESVDEVVSSVGETCRDLSRFPPAGQGEASSSETHVKAMATESIMNKARKHRECILS